MIPSTPMDKAELIGRLMFHGVSLLLAGDSDTEEYYATDELVALLLGKAVQS